MNKFDELMQHIDLKTTPFIEIGFINNDKIVLFLSDMYKVNEFIGELRENDKISDHLVIDKIKSCSSYEIKDDKIISIKKAYKLTIEDIYCDIDDILYYDRCDHDEYLDYKTYDFIVDTSKIVYITPIDIYSLSKNKNKQYTIGYKDEFKEVVEKQGLFKRVTKKICIAKYPKYNIDTKILLVEKDLLAFENKLDDVIKPFIVIYK